MMHLSLRVVKIRQLLEMFVLSALKKYVCSLNCEVLYNQEIVVCDTVWQVILLFYYILGYETLNR